MWVCMYCWHENKESSERCRCVISREIAEAREDEFTKDELLALSLAAKLGGKINKETIPMIAEAMGIRAEDLTELLRGVPEKLNVDRIGQTPRRVVKLRLLGREEDFE